MNASPVPSVTLANGVTMPQIGIGTWPLKADKAAKAVESVRTQDIV